MKYVRHPRHCLCEQCHASRQSSAIVILLGVLAFFLARFLGVL